MNRLVRTAAVALFTMTVFAPAATTAQQGFAVKPLAEKSVAVLPPGPLVWRLENFPSLAEAQAAAGPTGLAVESGGKVWLITLGPAVGSSGGSKVAEVGPIPTIAATQYVLRINQSGGPPGSASPEHTHPGVEAFYVLAGEISSRTASGTVRIAAGHGEAGHAADTPMQVSSSGSTDALSLVMFVVDAGKPFSSPAKIP
jgi:quercetin dioxygenase-like cupin family protein